MAQGLFQLGDAGGELRQGVNKVVDGALLSCLGSLHPGVQTLGAGERFVEADHQMVEPIQPTLHEPEPLVELIEAPLDLLTQVGKIGGRGSSGALFRCCDLRPKDRADLL